MQTILMFLRGKKTYMLVACALAVAGLDMGGLINDGSANMALSVLGFGSLATLRAGITNALAQTKMDAAAPAPPQKPAA